MVVGSEAAADTGEASAAGRPKRRLHIPRKVLIPLLVLLVIVVGVTGYLFVKTAQVSSKVFEGGGGVGGLISGGDPLKTDANGRINVLLFGTSQDDPSHRSDGGQGAWLTDSIQMFSVDPKTHTSVLVAIPRDTWVTVGGRCIVGEHAKINAVFECAAAGTPGTPGYDPKFFNSLQAEVSHYDKREAAGAKALTSVVGQITGLQPQYYVHVNYSVLRESVDAVGGIDVDIVGDGHEGIFDTNLDGDCPTEAKSCRHVYYPRDGVYHLDGVHALDLARARADGYSETNKHACMQFGLANGDFNRAANQQKILNALKAKASSAGTLTNPVKLNQLLSALGDNVRTDLSSGEGKSAIKLIGKLGQTPSISLVDPKHPVLEPGTEGSQSVIEPVAGTFTYGPVRAYIRKQIKVLAQPKPKPSASSSSGGSSPGTSPSTSPSPAPSPSAKSTYEPPITCSNN